MADRIRSGSEQLRVRIPLTMPTMTTMGGNPKEMTTLPDAASRRALDLIAGARDGDPRAMDDLFTLIYPELKRRARWLMAAERTGHTFGPSGSELVQRVIEKVLAAGGTVFSAVEEEDDLLNVLTKRMRLLLVDYARARAAAKSPAPRDRVSFKDAAPVWRVNVNIEQTLMIDELLDKLAAKDPMAARAYELRAFVGFTNEEAAAGMGLAVAKFRRLLKLATVFIETFGTQPGKP